MSRQASLTAAKFRLKQTSTTKNMKAWAESHMKSKWDLRGTGGNHAKDKLVKRFLVRHLLGPRHHETDRYRKHALSRNRQDMARMQEMEPPRKCASAAWPHRSSLPHSPPHAQRSMAGGTMHGHWPARQTQAASFIDHAHFQPCLPMLVNDAASYDVCGFAICAEPEFAFCDVASQSLLTLRSHLRSQPQ